MGSRPPHGTNYGKYISDLRQRITDRNAVALSIGAQVRVMETAVYSEGKLRLRFYSFKPGNRPDVVDTANLRVMPSPIGADHAPVVWTHALGGSVDGRYVLLIELATGGISPAQIEEYLERLIEWERRTGAVAPTPNEPLAHEPGPPVPEVQEPIATNLEAVPSNEFMQEVENLDRIKSATIHIVRPNPGWKDNEDQLSELAEESDAKLAALTFFSRRSASLNRLGGIIAVIRDKFRDHTLDAARVEGEKDGQDKTVSTKAKAIARLLHFDTDAKGQVDSKSAWTEMSKMFDELS